MKSNVFYGMRALQFFSKVIATFFSLAILIAASVETVQVFIQLLNNNITSAIQDGLFVLILLEMFYVVRSFIKYGSINISLVINVAMVAAVKEVIFRLDTMDVSTALTFLIIFVGLGIGFIIESYFFEKTLAK